MICWGKKMTNNDVYEIKNNLTPYTGDMIRLLSCEDISASDVENILRRVVDYTLRQAKEIRNRRQGNISEDDLGIIDIKDDNGFRRYNLKTCDDDGVMQPDKKGFWTPVNDLIKRGITLK
jgi:hypothetical protein